MYLIFNEPYKSKLEHIKLEVRKIEGNSRKSLVPYTPHGVESHIVQLEKLFDNIFPGEYIKTANDYFNDKEKFLFLASLWLHDVGMYCPLISGDPSENNTSMEELKKWDEEERRKKHHERSQRFILENYQQLGLDNNEAKDIALICLSHRKSQKIPEYTDDNIKLIIAYLRLLDALHIPERPSRDDLGKLRDYLASGMEPVSKFHWYKSFYVSEIKAEPDDLKLTIKFMLPREWIKNNEKMNPLINSVEIDIKDEIDAVKDILIKAKIKKNLPAYIYVDHDFKLTPYIEEEVDALDSLLAIIRLFDPSISPNSGEIINIVLDNMKRGIEGIDYTSCAKNFDAYIRGVLKPLLKDRPCHAYLWNLFEELEKHRIDLNEKRKSGTQNDLGELIKNIREMIRALQWWREEIPDMFNLESKISHNDSILLYGFSNTVITALKGLEDEVKNSISVYVCQCSTKTKHRYDNKILYYDGVQYIRKLRDIGIKRIMLIPDLCASNLFSYHQERKDPGIMRVIFGANGITNEFIFHSLGHLGIAEIAKISGRDVPIYVVSEGMKVRDKMERSPLHQRDGPWYPTDVSVIDYIKDATVYNPREDVVPIKYIAAVITEWGIYNTNEPWIQLKRISPDIQTILNEYRSRHKNINEGVQ